MWISSNLVTSLLPVLLAVLLLVVHRSDAIRFRNVYGLKSASVNEGRELIDDQIIDHDWRSELIREPNSTPEGSIRVRKLKGQLTEMSPHFDKSYTMYVTTNQTCDSNLFGWFFQNKVTIIF